MADETQTRVDSGIIEMWGKDGRLYAIAGFLVGIMIFPLLSSLGGDNLTSFLQELAPEAVGILVTVIVIDRLAEQRADRKAEEALKRQLIDDVASQSNEKAKDAVHQLFRKRWLRFEDGILKEQDLQDANLQGVVMQFANLRHTDLSYADLRGADLKLANMRGATLVGAKLQGAELDEADLRGADLALANLEGTKLGFGGIMFAKFNEKTTLPDGDTWNRMVDMEKYTNPDHSDFYSPPPVE